MTIHFGVHASNPETAYELMGVYLDSLPAKTEEQEAFWREHAAKARSGWRPKPGDPRRHVTQPTVDPLCDPATAA